MNQKEGRKGGVECHGKQRSASYLSPLRRYRRPLSVELGNVVGARLDPRAAFHARADLHDHNGALDACADHLERRKGRQ